VRLLQGEKLEDKARYELAALIASMHLRSDTMRQQYAGFEARTLTGMTQMMFSNDGAWAKFVERQAR